MNAPPRIAFFTDSFHEVNGVALTSRQLEAFAARRGYPFLSVHTGPRNKSWQDGSITRLEIQLSTFTLGLEKDLRFDLFFFRKRNTVRRALGEFKPDLIHITGPSHHGMMGAILAYELKIPLVASWHTNVHEFGGRRLAHNLRFLPGDWSKKVGLAFESVSLTATARFYRLAHVLLAPNQGLIEMLESRTARRCFLMQRGVDTSLYSPLKRTRRDDTFVLGYAGRLSPEKSVRFLAAVEECLRAAGITNYRFLVVGHGGEEEWLKANLKQADFPGVLKGEALAEAYANMDLFLFPSHTDTYGNVIQEAMASGVPCVVTNGGGPRYLVTPGVDGFIATDDQMFCDAVLTLVRDREQHHKMRLASRETALQATWDSVFDRVYQVYHYCLNSALVGEPRMLRHPEGA